MDVSSRAGALLGISFRPLQAQAFGLDVRPTLTQLLEYPVEIVRLGAYWNLIEPRPDVFDPSALDWQIDTVERIGAKIILCVGALKTFGYPEFHFPRHLLAHPFPNGATITPEVYPDLLDAATNFISRIVDRYKDRSSIVAWQLENEPLEPLAFAHYWRLSTSFLLREFQAMRAVDRLKPVMINGYLPTALAVRVGQQALTRDQGDSLAFARQHAQILGVDYYPRIGIRDLGRKTLYLDSTGTPWGDGDRDSLASWVRDHGQKLIVAENQAEPWETETVPPSPRYAELHSCTPGDMISNYNWWAKWAAKHPVYAHLLWGAEYWVRRQLDGDSRYLSAFQRILERAHR